MFVMFRCFISDVYDLRCYTSGNEQIEMNKVQQEKTSTGKNCKSATGAECKTKKSNMK